MARLDLYRNREGRGYLLDVQADILRTLDSRIVIPVLPVDAAPPRAGRLNPLITIEGEDHSAVTQHMAAVPIALFGEIAGSLAARDIEITAAIDLLIWGL